MRRSASPSKMSRSGGVRSGDESSSSVLKTPFKPLSGLDGRRTVLCPEPTVSTTTTVVARSLRTRSIEELQEEVAQMTLVLTESLDKHNGARQSAGKEEQTPEGIVREYISLLTEYNKVKDAAQVVFDKIAEIEQLPAKDIHARYGVAESE